MNKVKNHLHKIVSLYITMDSTSSLLEQRLLSSQFDHSFRKLSHHQKNAK